MSRSLINGRPNDKNDKKKKKNIKDGSFRSYVIGIEERLNVSQQDRNCL